MKDTSEVLTAASLPAQIFLQVVSILRIAPDPSTSILHTQFIPLLATPSPSPCSPRIISPFWSILHVVPETAVTHTLSMAPHYPPRRSPRLPTWGLRVLWDLVPALSLSSPITLIHSQWAPSPLISLLMLLQGEFVEKATFGQGWHKVEESRTSPLREEDQVGL